MELLFNNVKEFRAKATDEDYLALYDYYLIAKSDDWTGVDCPYGFSRSSAYNVLCERGLITNKQDNRQGLDINFATLSTSKHTLYLTDEVWDRLNNIYANYNAVSKQNVLDAFMRKALDDLGL